MDITPIKTDADYRAALAKYRHAPHPGAPA